MFNYKGCNCSVCEKPLTENDDIVVCPECGTPYHRACYAEKGACVHADKHAHGYEFAKPKGAHDDTLTCNECKTKNSSENIFCENCGQPLHAGTKPMQQNIVPDAPPAYLGMPVVSPSEEIDGVPAGDWNEYIGTSTPYYFYQFKHMDMQKRKTAICWSAFLFPPIYFFFRRMWLWGVAAVASAVVLQIPSFLTLSQEAGFAFAAGFSEPALRFLNYIAMLLYYALKIAWGVYAIYLFRNHAGKRLRAMRKRAPSDEKYREVLSRTAGPSVVGVVCLIMLLSILSFAFMYFAGSDLLMALGLL